MSLAEIVAGVLVIGLVLFDVFQAVIVPRPSTSGIGLARYIVATTWRLWRRYGESLAQANKRERRLGAYAPFILVQLLESMGRLKLIDDLPALFLAWEKWAAEVLDSHLAYPLLCFFRSSHDNESWVSALGALLDAATLCLTTVEGCPEGRAKLLLAIGAHLVEDVSQYFRIAHEHGVIVERSEFDAARSRLADAGWVLRDAERSWSDFQRIRGRYAGDLEGMAHFWAVPPAQWIGDRSVLRHATA